ncbi:MAG: MBL fold metallo-hydrolase [Nitrospinae bacterium]|nr:MBL fold metallo-hydrolase [Nitrospinota bacterium]
MNYLERKNYFKNNNSLKLSPMETKGCGVIIPNTFIDIHLYEELLLMVMYSPGRTTSYPSSPIEKGFRFHFLGGGNEVGNVGCILEDHTGTKLLMDYGMAPTSPPRYPREAPMVSDCILTHSHIDHIGMAPWLASNHGTLLHCTALTKMIIEPMWHDCYKVSKIEGYPLAWDKRDLDEALANRRPHPFYEENQLGQWKWKFLPAGHIPGAAMTLIETGDKKILFSGDFDTRDSELVSGAQPIDCDILFIEGTYAGRSHPNKDEERERFLERVLEVVERNGTCLIPAFANGRTQDILMLLHRTNPQLNVHIDGMGKRLAKMYLENEEYLRDKDALISALSWAKKVGSKSDKKKALEADVIITTSGMLNGGPSIWYLNRLRNDLRNAILLTGYQAEDTGGRMLLEQKRISIFGNISPIDLEVDQFSFSTHAGQQELVDFVEGCKPKDVVIYHTDSTQSRPLLAEILQNKGYNVHCPENGETYYILE